MRACFRLLGLVYLWQLSLGGLWPANQAAEQVSTVPGSAGAAGISDWSAPSPGGTNRVTAAIRLEPKTASPGDLVRMTVKVRVAPGHWIYAMDHSGTRNVPTKMSVPEDGPLVLAGHWRSVGSKLKDDGSRVHTGEAVFEAQFRVRESASARVRHVPVKLSYQVCNEALCWPPATILLEPQFNVLSSP